MNDPASLLGPGERAVLGAILDGSPDSVIADSLGVTQDELSGHVSSLIARLVGLEPPGAGAGRRDDGGRHRRRGS